MAGGTGREDPLCIQWTWVSPLLGKILPKTLGLKLPGYHTDPHVARNYWGWTAFLLMTWEFTVVNRKEMAETWSPRAPPLGQSQ